MRTPRTARFDLTVRESHTIVSTADVLYGGIVLHEGIAITGGTYVDDSSAAVRGRIEGFEVADTSLIPTAAGVGPLTPYGYELRVRSGIVYGDGTSELLNLGIFPIQTARVDGVTLITSGTAFDRSQTVIDARHEDDYAVAAGTNYATAIATIILDGVPGATFNLPTTTFTTPELVFPMGSDRWANAQSMAAACGWQLYADSLGRYAARHEPSLSTTSSQWTIDDGATGVLVSSVLDLDRGPAYNKVVATGENTSLGAVYSGSATDNDPASPSFYSGPFGRKPMFYASPLFTSDL